jgi:phospholipid transport system substrate-binding protein
MRACTFLIATLALSAMLTGVSVPTQAALLDRDTVGTSAIEIAATKSADTGAKAFIDDMGKKAISFLGNEAYSQTQKEAEFRRLLKNSFDMKTIGRFALGRYWSTATAQQQQEYLSLFETMVVGVYAQRFNEYKGQSLDVASFRPDGDKDTLVTSYIVDPKGAGKFQVDWRVRNKGGTYKVVDVIIEGVSMSLTQRSDFASVIQRGGGNVQSLLEHLRGNNPQ